MKKVGLTIFLLYLWSISLSAQTYCLIANKVSETPTTLTVTFTLSSSSAAMLDADVTFSIAGGGGISGSSIVAGNGKIGMGNIFLVNNPALNPSAVYTYNIENNTPAQFIVDDLTSGLGVYVPVRIERDAGCPINNLTVLPLELKSFTATKEKGNRGDKTLVKWESVGEKNLETYIVERSEDGKNFKAIGFERPKAKSETEKVDYNLTDDSPAIGINYYRLQSTSINKKVEYSKIVSVDFGLGIKAKAYPNPFAAELSIEIDVEEGIKGEVTIDMFDTAGKQVLNKKINAEGRKLIFEVPTEGLVPGSYVIRVKNGSTTWQHKITKQ
jgi:Secretion system C-terminal sorting domain